MKSFVCSLRHNGILGGGLCFAIGVVLFVASWIAVIKDIKKNKKDKEDK